MLGSMQCKHEKEAFTRSLVTVSFKPHLVRLTKLVMDAPAKIPSNSSNRATSNDSGQKSFGCTVVGTAMEES